MTALSAHVDRESFQRLKYCPVWRLLYKCNRSSK